MTEANKTEQSVKWISSPQSVNEERVAMLPLLVEHFDAEFDAQAVAACVTSSAHKVLVLLEAITNADDDKKELVREMARIFKASATWALIYSALLAGPASTTTGLIDSVKRAEHMLDNKIEFQRLLQAPQLTSAAMILCEADPRMSAGLMVRYVAHTLVLITGDNRTTTEMVSTFLLSIIDTLNNELGEGWEDSRRGSHA